MVQSASRGSFRLERRPAPRAYKLSPASQPKLAGQAGLVKSRTPADAHVNIATPRLCTPTCTGAGAAGHVAPKIAANLNRYRLPVVQRVKAYRVGTKNSKYKITISGGKITGMSGGRSGIDISFGDRAHADYYFETKKSDKEAVLDEWDFSDKVYDLIVYRMKFPMKTACPKDGDESIWSDIKKLPAPVNSSDQFVRENNQIAPHFPLEWIPLLEKYSKNKVVTRTTVEEAFPEEEVVEEISDSELQGEAYQIEAGIEVDVQQMTKKEFDDEEWAKAGYQFRTV